MSYYMGDPSFQRQSQMLPMNPEIAINNNNFVVYGQQMPSMAPVFPVTQQAKPSAAGADVYGQALPTINVIGPNGLCAPNIQPNAQQSVNPDGSININISFNAPDVKPQDACACLKDLKDSLSWLKKNGSSLEEMFEEMKDELPEKTAKFLTKILKGDLDERFGKIEEQIASGVLKIDKKIEASIERFSGDIANLKKSMKEENHDLKKSLKKFVKEQNKELLSKIGDMMDEKLDAKLAKVTGQVEKTGKAGVDATEGAKAELKKDLAGVKEEVTKKVTEEAKGTNDFLAKMKEELSGEHTKGFKETADRMNAGFEGVNKAVLDAKGVLSTEHKGLGDKVDTHDKKVESSFKSLGDRVDVHDKEVKGVMDGLSKQVKSVGDGVNANGEDIKKNGNAIRTLDDTVGKNHTASMGRMEKLTQEADVRQTALLGRMEGLDQTAEKRQTALLEGIEKLKQQIVKLPADVKAELKPDFDLIKGIGEEITKTLAKMQETARTDKEELLDKLTTLSELLTDKVAELNKKITDETTKLYGQASDNQKASIKRMNKLSTELSDVQKNLTKAINKLPADVKTALEPDLLALQNAIESDLVIGFNTLASAMVTLSNQVTSVETNLGLKIDNLPDAVKVALQPDLDTITKTGAEIKKTLDEMKLADETRQVALLEALKQQTLKFETQVQALTTKVGAVETTLAGNTAAVNGLNASVMASDSSIKTLNATVDTLRNTIGTLSTTIAGLKKS